jgi:hypothetical protein
VSLGTDAATYQSALSTLGQRQLLEPLVLLDGVRGTPSTLSNLRLPALKLDGLFMERDPSPLTPAASPVLQITPPRGMFASGLASPQSPCISSVPYASSGPRLVDPTKASHHRALRVAILTNEYVMTAPASPYASEQVRCSPIAHMILQSRLRPAMSTT